MAMKTTGPTQPALRFCFLSPGRWSMDVLGGDTRPSGGAEAQIARIAASFAALGHEVSLIYGSGGRGERCERSGVTCIDIYPAWRRPRSLVGFWRTLKTLSPDIIYARLPDDFLWLAGLLARLHSRARFVYGLANDQHANPWTAFGYRSWFHNPLYALGLRSAGVLAVQHEGQAAMVRQHTRAPIAQLPNLGPNFTAGPRPFAQADIDVLWVAQIRPEKQLPLLLDLAISMPELRFAVIGGFVGALPKDEEAQLEARMLQLPNLEYLGPQPHDAIAAALARSKALVNTSRAEGFPNTMLEAWALGVPVVSLSVNPGGVITREGLGLVSGGVGGLAADLRRICADRRLNESCGARGAAYVQAHHSVEAVHKAFIDLWAGAARSQGAISGGFYE
jgi:glycosyltransferase involved in cell wall biosynthesis